MAWSLEVSLLSAEPVPPDELPPVLELLPVPVPVEPLAPLEPPLPLPELPLPLLPVVAFMFGGEGGGVAYVVVGKDVVDGLEADVVLLELLLPPDAPTPVPLLPEPLVPEPLPPAPPEFADVPPDPEPLDAGAVALPELPAEEPPAVLAVPAGPLTDVVTGADST